MSFTRSLIDLVLCATVAGCAANPYPEATFFVPGTDTPIAASGPTWVIAVGPSPADWSYDPISAVIPLRVRGAAVSPAEFRPPRLGNPPENDPVTQQHCCRCLVPVDNFYEWKKTPTGSSPMQSRVRTAADGSGRPLGDLALTGG